MMNEDQKDALGELINISFGSATRMIADLFDSFATLRVPDISIVKMNEISPVVMEGSEDEEIYITGQQFMGNFAGEVVFVIDKDGAKNMQKLIFTSQGIESESDGDDNEIAQSILEISNILGSSCVGRLVELLNEDVMFSPPTIELTRQVLSGLDKERFDQIIVIRTALEFEEEQIAGKLFIMFNNEMFSTLEKALELFLEEI